MIAHQTGIILTNARLLEETKHRTEQISLLNETAKKINSSLVLDDILENAISVVQKTLRMNEIAVYIPAEDESILEMRACSGHFHKQIKEQGYIQSVQMGFLGNAFRNAKTVYSNDCRNHPLFLPHPLIPTQSEACIPVKRADKVLAVLNVESPDLNAFSSGDILTLETLADQLAIAFHNAVVYESEHKHNDQILLLSELISELALIVDRDMIMKTTVERIKHRFQYYFLAAGFVNEEAKVIEHWYYSPKFEILKDAIRQIPIDKGLVGKAVRTGKSILVRDTAQSEDYLKVLDEVRSELVTPVKMGDRVVAVLDLESDRVGAFDESDQVIMEILANALSTALQNADSYSRMERINKQLADVAKMKDEIVQIVAHDFRSPLTVIRGYMDFLLKRGDWKDEKQKEIMETVSLQAQRLQKLAEATLKASRLDAGDIAFSYEKLDFKSFLQRLIFPWSEKHKFVVTTEPNLPLVKADAGRLHEVIENLLSNAIKYSPDGGTIEVSARKTAPSELPPDLFADSSNAFLLVSVSDEGIGIPQDKRRLLFQRFTRIHENRRIEGIGLGLYIAKKMIETQGGRIWLEDKEKGTRFCFAIPAHEDDSEKESILVVDDDVHTLRLLHKALSDAGYDVVTATEGKEALDKVARFHSRLVICDALMPGISGLELIQ
ncbi:MAG TPA: GAF domain-containing protein, partial [Acidobacteriota bacterium]|nr:GAF domain-containing protein [Acidobacteriota bacterium]